MVHESGWDLQTFQISGVLEVAEICATTLNRVFGSLKTSGSAFFSFLFLGSGSRFDVAFRSLRGGDCCA